MFISYRDPLFGIIVFFLFIFVISALTYVFSLYKEKKARKEYRKLLKRFELGSLKEDDYIHLYQTYNLPFDSIILLASTFLHKGQYNKAISVYLTLLKIVENQVQKEELLELLGTTYFKGGFLQRSKDIFLKILKFSPRNRNALHYLLIIHEKLNDFKGASDVIDVLEELNDVTIEQKNYIKALELINHPTNTYEQISYDLIKLLKEDESIERLVAQYLIKYNKPLFWSNIALFDLENLVDLLWYFEFDDIDFNTVETNDFLQEIYCAKGYLKRDVKSSKFELDLLINLQRNNYEKANLNFNYSCKKCKKVSPIFDKRCINCNSILSLKPTMKISKQLNQEIASLV